MLSKEEIEKAFEGMEYFIDDDMGGYYKSVVGNQEANSMLGYLKIRDYILNLQNKVEQLETNNKKLIEYIEKKMSEYDETIIELVLQNVLAVVKGEK